jgi:hypothetical protein
MLISRYCVDIWLRLLMILPRHTGQEALWIIIGYEMRDIFGAI